MPRSTDRPLLHALLLGVLLVTLIAVPAPASARPIEFDADASGSALVSPTANPSVYSVQIAAFGSSTLGHVRLEGTHAVDLSTGVLSNGVLTLTLIPGGEKVVGTYSGQAFPTADPKEFRIEGEVVFTGGTGRFARARGQGGFQGDLRIRNIAPDGTLREEINLQFDGQLNF